MKIQTKNKVISSIVSRISKTVEKSYVFINLIRNTKFEPLNGESKLRFVVISDIHIAPTKCLEKRKFRDIFSTMYNLDSNMDAIAIVGDLTDSGSKKEYNSFKKILDKNKKEETILIASMGNHEQNTPSEFISVTGRNPRENLVINGYHFITVSPRLSEDKYGGNRYNLDEIWMKEQLEYASLEDVYKPIFVFIHHGIKNTAYGTEQWYTEDLAKLFNDYPQVIQFSGHSHYPLNSPKSIYQKDFTSINTSTTSYFELEEGMMYGTIPPKANTACQMMVIEVEGTEVKVKKLDLSSGEYIGKEWSINTAKGKSGFKYIESRTQKSMAPYFEENAKMLISKVKRDGCLVTINQAKINNTVEEDIDDIVHSYKFDFIDKKTGDISYSFKVWSEFYFLPRKDYLVQEFNQLKPDTDYEIVVNAYNAYGKVSINQLRASFKTNYL